MDDRSLKNPVAVALTAIDLEDERLPLLAYEQNLMVDTFIDDVIFITAKGLGLERLFFNHLHLYCIPNFTVLVINTTQEDEHFYLEKLRALNSVCPPKLITADVLSKDRKVIYRSGGVQFVTSRILMVDLLTDIIPFDFVAGILVYRAHELLSGFQESFILRLFREKKEHGFVKAFTDNCMPIACDGIGQLQRLVRLLYVKKVVVLPRFHEEVKDCLNKEQNFMQMTIQLDNVRRKVQANLRDIIGTCVRELKQCTKEMDPETELEVLAPSATLRPTKLELDLRKRDLTLTERQQRLLSDLHTLRTIFHKVEDLDPTNAMGFLHRIRTDREVIENNGGWLFTQSAANLASNIDSLCSLRDSQGNRTISIPPKWPVFCAILEEIADKMGSEDSNVLVLVSNEYLSRQLIDLAKFGQHRYAWMLARVMEQLSKRDSLVNAPPIKPIWNPSMVAHYDQQLFEKDRQDLRVQVKNIQKEVTKQHRKRGKKIVLENDGSKQPRLDQFGICPTANTKKRTDCNKTKKEFCKRTNKIEPPSKPISTIAPSIEKLPLAKETIPEGMLPEDPLTSFYENEHEGHCISNCVDQPEASNGDSVLALEEDNPIQELDHQLDSRAPIRNYYCTEPSTSGGEKNNAKESAFSGDENSLNLSSDDLSNLLPPNIQSIRSMLVFLELGNNRYRLINCLEAIRPKHVIIYSTDLACTRVIEVFKALNRDHAMEIHVLICSGSSEEERYLSSIQRETDAIEALIKEQGVLMVPREFDVSRDSVSQLRRLTMQRADSRNRATTQIISEEFESEMRPLVIVDMREFNSELPTVLYRRGIDLSAATLEVGDYILSPDICVERKSLDDLFQSLTNGRIFKQIEQMHRNYPVCILLIESNEKLRNRSVRTGAFQGELSKRSREARSLLAMLIRAYPNLHVFWSLSPAHSAEFFEELKLDQPNPIVNDALKKRRGEPAKGQNEEEEKSLDVTLPDYY